jgi:ABC-type sulfate transport system permease subunit
MEKLERLVDQTNCDSIILKRKVMIRLLQTGRLLMRNHIVLIYNRYPCTNVFAYSSVLLLFAVVTVVYSKF